MFWNLFLSCSSQKVNDQSCNGNYLFSFEQEVVLSGQIQDYFDRDCDQIPLIDDCDDRNPDLLSKRYDVDCDGIIDRKIIASGAMHNCAIFPNAFGEVTCWGSDYFSQIDSPSGLFLEISAGEQHTCGLSILNEIVCWGDNTYGQLDAPQGRYKDVYSGDKHSCGLLEDDSIVCWGAGSSNLNCDPDNGFLECGQSIPPNAKFSSLSLGSVHSCGIQLDGTIRCWGDNSLGQTTSPIGHFIELSTHHKLSCAIDVDGRTSCWGILAAEIEECNNTCSSAFDGECDDGVLNAEFSTCDPGSDCSDCGTRFIEEERTSDLPVLHLSIGENNLCYVNTTGNLFCTNPLSSAELGTNDFISPSQYSQSKYKVFDIGPFYNGCGVTFDGRLECWGASCWKQEDLSFNCMYGPLHAPDITLWSHPSAP